MTPFWQQQPTTKFGTTTTLRLGTGAVDVEKGNIYSVPAGTPISIPAAGKIEWEDSEHVVVRTAQGILNFLHVNPSKSTGSYIRPNESFGTASRLVGSRTDPTSHINYVESGNIIEVGLYDTVRRAINRENFSASGQDQPYNFTGIQDPSHLFSSWQTGTPYVPGFMSFPPMLLIAGAVLLLVLLLRR
jgi:hypothetical protein